MTFDKLFRGLSRAHGLYELGKRLPSGKVGGKAKTVKGDVTEVLWQMHLEGKQGLGIVPIMDDGCCYWGCIDIDVYDLDFDELETKINQLKLPLVICKTKSGGAHLYVFFKISIQAKILRQKLGEWAVALGYPGVEIFPKQDQLDEKDVGNWVNLPYFNAERSLRQCYLNGKELKLEAFLEYAETKLLTAETFDAIKLKKDKTTAQFKGIPPCLQHLIKVGFPQGTKNNGLFNLAVYARKRYGDQDFENYVGEYNSRFMKGSNAEVNNVIRQLKKKEFQYLCSQPPIVDFCSKEICANREFGVMPSGHDLGLLFDDVTLIKQNPPMWFISIQGTRIRIDNTADLMNQSYFMQRCVEVMQVWPKPMKQESWRMLVNEKIKEATIVDMADDSSVEGQFLFYLQKYSERPKGNARDELTVDRLWVEDGRFYFRLPHFLEILKQQRFFDIKPHQAGAVLKEYGATHHKFNLKGKYVNCWSFPVFEEQTEPLDPAEIETGDF